MNVTEQLKPCPFCRARAHVTYVSDFRISFPRTGRRVSCQNCSASTGVFETEAQAVEAWNRRAQPAQASQEAMTRFCPGCGSVGEVEAKYRDCCPDGGKARVIPESLAKHCHGLFQLALQGAAPQAARAPLKFTPRQRKRLWDNSPEIQPDARSFAGFERIVSLTEAAHGITGTEGGE